MNYKLKNLAARSGLKKSKRIVAKLVAMFICAVSLQSIKATPSFQQLDNVLVMFNGNVRLEYNLNAGTTDFFWKNSKKISAFYSGIGLNTGYADQFI